MTDTTRYRLTLWRSMDMPADLAAVVSLVALTAGAVLVPGLRQTPLRLVLGLPFLLFAPGYAFVAALFPERAASVRDERRATDTDRVVAWRSPGRRGRSIGGLMRVALSFGTSFALVSLVGLGLDGTSFGLTLPSMLTSVGGVTVGSTLVAAQRRRALPEDRRFSVPFRRWFATVRTELLRPQSGVDLGLNVLLVATFLLAAVSVGYAVAPPAGDSGVTELFLLTESDDGDLVAADYPIEGGQSIVVGVNNRERGTNRYTLVVQRQPIGGDGESGNGTGAVVDRETQRRFAMTLQPNEGWRESLQIGQANDTGRVRIAFLLYEGTPPATPRIGNAYRATHLWLDGSA